MNFMDLNTVEPCLISAANIKRSNCPPPGTSFGTRRVENYELDFITWGEGYIMTEGKKIPARKGDLFFRKPGMVVEGVSPYHCYFIIFDMFGNKTSIHQSKSSAGNPVPAGQDKWDIPGFPYCMNIANYTYLEELFSGLYNEYIIQGEVSPFVTKTYLMQILLAMYHHWISKSRFENSRKSLQRNNEKILAVREYMDKNPQLRFTLDGLAEMSGFSRFFFCRIFKEIIGESPINYMIKCKLNKAKRSLVETEKSVKEIALECGFDNESHFFKLFKKHVGVSPATYGHASRKWRN